MDRYCIKEGYVENPIPAYFVDDVTQDRGLVFQPDVYPFAQDLVDASARVPANPPLTRPMSTASPRVTDVGCGRADKLAMIRERRPDWDFVGIDFGPNIEWCRNAYGWGTWLDVDLERPHELDADGGLVIASDVIEHLKDPLPLLAAIRASGCAGAVLSTPERDENYGPGHNGPPTNPCHVREWNLAEFGALLVREGFAVTHLGLTRSVDTQPYLRTILAVAVPA